MSSDDKHGLADFAEGELHIDVDVLCDALVLTWQGSADCTAIDPFRAFLERVADEASQRGAAVAMVLPTPHEMDASTLGAVVAALRRLREQNTRTFVRPRSLRFDSQHPQRTRRAMVHLEITLKIADANRPAAVNVYTRYRAPFLEKVAGARTKQLLVRDEDVQVLHGFDTEEQANAYLRNPLFTADIVDALTPLLSSPPDVRIYRAVD